MAIDALRRREPDLAGKAVATWQTVGNRRALVCVDAPHLHAGQALADAQAMLPDLVLRPADSASEAELLQRLGHWALRFTPIVALDVPDGLILDVSGCTDLFGGELAMLIEVERCFRRAGYRARVGLAGSANAATALVRAGHNGVVVPVGGDLTAIAALPVAALRLPSEVASGLARLGLLTLGDVLRQPRAPLTRRFGRLLLDALDFASGTRGRPLTLVQPPAAMLAIRSFLEPIVTRPAIDRALDALLDELCATLGESGSGARRLSLLAFRVDGDVQEVAIGVGSPSRDAAHLRRLFAEPLGTLEPDLGFERIILRATETNALQARQLSGSLGGAALAGENERVLSELIDRLGQRAVVWRVAPTGSHWPEDAVAMVDPYTTPEEPDVWEERRRPVRLLRQPKELAVLAEVPDGPPARLRLDGRVYRVRHAAGPERLEPEWWGDKHDRPRRDYFRVETEEGSRLWVCRLGQDRPAAPARWFLHGIMG
ncbi:MAG: DNA polymerase Y family protein [Roseomonas mucosa]|nr:DNA polymerase Y family protein [Roseomonas mucosa]